MKHSVWSLLLIIGSILFTGCVTKGKFRNLQSQYNDLTRDYQQSQLQLTENRTLAGGLESRLTEAQKYNDELRTALNQCLSQTSQGNINIGKLVDEINASNRFIQHLVQAKNRSDSLNLLLVSNLTRSLSPTESQDIDIQVLKGVVYISLDDKMLYRSGSYEITSTAGEILSKVAKIILDYRDYDVLVEGNTDTDPISRSNIRNNWDLSVLRGSSVVQALQTNYGVDPRRLTAAGRGEYNPIATNSTVAGKERNRRTQIILTPNLDQFMDLIEQAPTTSFDAY